MILVPWITVCAVLAAPLGQGLPSGGCGGGASCPGDTVCARHEGAFRCQCTDLCSTHTGQPSLCDLPPGTEVEDEGACTGPHYAEMTQGSGTVVCGPVSMHVTDHSTIIITFKCCSSDGHVAYKSCFKKSTGVTEPVEAAIGPITAPTTTTDGSFTLPADEPGAEPPKITIGPIPEPTTAPPPIEITIEPPIENTTLKPTEPTCSNKKCPPKDKKCKELSKKLVQLKQKKKQLQNRIARKNKQISAKIKEREKLLAVIREREDKLLDLENDLVTWQDLLTLEKAKMVKLRAKIVSGEIQEPQGSKLIRRLSNSIAQLERKASHADKLAAKQRKLIEAITKRAKGKLLERVALVVELNAMIAELDRLVRRCNELCEKINKRAKNGHK